MLLSELALLLPCELTEFFMLFHYVCYNFNFVALSALLLILAEQNVM